MAASQEDSVCSVNCEFSSNDFLGAVLDRVRAFLTIVDEANRKLMAGIEEKGQQELDIEAGSANCAAPHIEMVFAIKLCFLPPILMAAIFCVTKLPVTLMFVYE